MSKFGNLLQQTMPSLENMSNWQLYQSFTEGQISIKNCEQNYNWLVEENSQKYFCTAVANFPAVVAYIKMMILIYATPCLSGGGGDRFN